VKVAWSRLAESDLNDQVHYIAQDNLDAAFRMQDRVLERVAGLAKHPEAGRVGRVPGTRELPITGTAYVAIYEVRDGAVLVMRLLHGAQNWPPASEKK